MQYIVANEKDNQLLSSSKTIQNEIDLIKRFKAECIDYVNCPSMSALLTLPKDSLSNNFQTQIILNLARCLDIRQQIALNRTSKNALKQSQIERSLADKNSVSSSELAEVSSIIEIGLKSNCAMLNAVSVSTKSNANKLMIKILNVLTNLLSHLGPLSLKKKPLPLLQKVLIELIKNSKKYKIDKSFPLQSLLTLTLTQCSLHSTINTINTLFDAGIH